MWVAAKAVLKGKFIAVNAYIRKQGWSQINNLSFHLNKLGKEQIKSKESRRKKINKSRNKWNCKQHWTEPKAGSLKRLIKLINL